MGKVKKSILVKTCSTNKINDNNSKNCSRHSFPQFSIMTTHEFFCLSQNVYRIDNGDDQEKQTNYLTGNVHKIRAQWVLQKHHYKLQRGLYGTL